MSIYYRFYIKTQSPRRVEQLILHTLGGDGWLEPYGNGYLRPIQIAVVPGEAHVVLPDRNRYGSPITSDADTGWFWLEAQIKIYSPEAVALAKALLPDRRHRYPLIEELAVDSEANEAGDFARIVDDEHYLIDVDPSESEACCPV
ncbi:hypothetical protein [Pseudomonas sp. PDM25]|uniref:hypothetical protein n=1 Tax=Pseudomonas sp. PDM25 TaxID=2854772 RepID=UPI001C45B428|nr:hypothetical protein [Pseudomonas sp. PDM25]MBV7514566.1 hypothetical protein [Pseudomonas sp. PDM25]